MIYRLTVEDGEDIRHFDLGPGQHLVGSSPECDVRLGSPVISRRHARLVMEVEGVSVEDLGSTNGTSLNGERLASAAAAAVPVELAFGTLSARLERIEEEDIEAGIRFPLEQPATTPREISGTTAGLRGPYQFVVRELPQILARLADGETVSSLAPSLGAALFEALPCPRLEIVDEDGAALFAAEGSPQDESHVVVRRHGMQATFLNHAHARAWEPVVDIASHMLVLTDRDPSATVTESQAEAPPMPAPESVVPVVRGLYRQAARLALGDVGALITGESGTGKEVLASYIHRASHRSGQPLITLNCAALPADLLEAELFGVEKGAATGVTERPGRFEQAHGGTLLLDEIGDMRADTQAKILRAIEEKQVYRLGGVKPREADARVLAATNRDIDDLLSSGAFRRDLYHRIADWRAELPPLRVRRADIRNLAAYFLRRECQRRGIAIAGISKAALAALESYPWPGNIRELEREMVRVALVVEDGQLVEKQHLRSEIAAAEVGATPPESLQARLEAAERAAIVEALSACDGSVAEAARRLAAARSTLYRRIQHLGIATDRESD